MNETREKIIDHLRKSSEPSIRYNIALNIDGNDPNSNEMITLQKEIQTSKRVKSLLEGLDGKHPYSKWQGAHWILSLLAELHYPKGDSSLLPLMKQVYDWLFSQQHLQSIQTINGKVRRCASQEGNALYYSIVLNILDNEKNEKLVGRLIDYQWEDGGWNCDKSSTAHNSSYNESLLPFRGLLHYYKNTTSNSVSHNKKLKTAINRAKDVFLKRQLYISQTNGEEMVWRNRIKFTDLHFPYYWHYNILLALKVMKEGGFLSDPRCKNALDLIESKELPTGGFPAEKRYYYSATAQSGRSVVSWGGVKQNKLNEWVSSEVYSILKSSGRL